MECSSNQRLEGLESKWDLETINEKEALLHVLRKQNRLRVHFGYHFTQMPDPIIKNRSQWPNLWDRVEGMMLGLAIGDSLGNRSEGQKPQTRRARYHGDIRDYVANQFSSGNKHGVPSDDTQLAFWTLEELNRHKRLVPEALAMRIANERVFGIGKTVRTFKHLWRSGVRPWYRCSPSSAGNGALMRVAPIIIPYLFKPSTDLWYDAAVLSVITHMDGASLAACVAFINILWHLLGMETAPEPDWWAKTYLSTAQVIEADPNYESRTARIPYRGLLWHFVWDEIQKAHERNLTTLQAAEHWYSGAYLMETVPTVLYILSKHADDPEEAMVRAVNDTKDSDTIGAIVGTAVGALYGKKALPTRWIDGLTGRTRADDDGAIFEILDQADKIFGPPYEWDGITHDPGKYHS